MDEHVGEPLQFLALLRIAHALSGAGGIYGYAELSDVAAQLEDTVIAELGGQGSCDETDRALDGLIGQAEQHRDPGGQQA